MANFMTSHAVFIGNTDYPEYCPGCGGELSDDEGDI